MIERNGYMSKKSVKLRLVLLIMAITIVFGQVVPTMVFAESNTSVNYKPKRQKYAIAPQALYKDVNFYNQYVKTEGKWAFNSITYFTGNELNYNQEMQDYNKKFEKVFYEFDPVMDELRKKGQLWVNLRVNLANTKSGLSSKHSIQEAKIINHLSYSSNADDTSYRTHGDMDYRQYTPQSLILEFIRHGEKKKDTKVKNVSLVFADADNPNISKIYATATNDINGSAKTSFGENDKYVYIHVKFDEYIRFSDNKADHADVYLKLKVFQGGNQVTGADERASLISLEDDTLTFRYEIPELIRGIKTDHFINGFYGMYDANGKNVLNAGGGAYSLSVLTATGELVGHNAPGLIKYTSKSLITDLAGNPSGSTSVPSPTAAIHIDTTSPVVKKVEITAVGDKSQFIGVGGSITPKVTFTEPLYFESGGGTLNKYNNNYSTNIGVILNIKDELGNYVTMTGKYFEDEGKADTLIFNSKTINEGMTLEEGADRIKIKNFYYYNEKWKAYDGRRNLLDIDSIPVPENQFIIDIEKPEVWSDMQQKGEYYIPVIYDSKGTNTLDSFYFSFSMSDALSGLLPKGEEILNGSFKLSLDDGGTGTTKSFEYAVSDRVDPPDVYKKGSFGLDHTFPQGSNMYLHIRFTGLEEVNLRETTLSITANDLVGNSATGNFKLYGNEFADILDRTPPQISADRLYSLKDDNGWKFAADFTLYDYNEIDTSKVEYQWVSKDGYPSDGQWLTYQGLAGNAQTFVANVYYNLVDNDINEYDLYIRVTDCSRNQNTQMSGPYCFTKDLRAPVFTSEVSGNLTDKAKLKITAFQQIQTVGEEEYDIPAVVLIMLEDGSEYSVKTVSADSDIWIENVFDSKEDWVGNENLITKLVDGKYYGEAKVKIVMGYGISFENGEVKNTYGGNLSEQEYTLYTAPSQDKIHNIEMTSSIKDKSFWSSPDDGAKYYTDLAGCNFNISVSNALMEEWGAKDMDFSNSYFALCKEDGVEIYKTPIGILSQISIPAGLNLEEGKYYAKAVVTAKTSGQVDEKRIEDIIVDVTKPSDFGLAKTETEIIFRDFISNPPPIDIKTVYYGYDAVNNPLEGNLDKSYGGAPQLFWGSAIDEIIKDIKHRLYFTTLSTNNEMYIKLWNASNGVDAEVSKRAAKWLQVGNTSNNAFDVIIVNSAEDVISNDNEFNIPLINNEENILYYQVCHANGEGSGERVMLINVSDEKAELEVELKPNDKPSQTVTATVTKLESPSTPELEVMYWNGTDTLKVIEDIDILQKYDNWFYTQNIYGNYTFLNKEAALLDKEEPIISTSQGLGEGDGYGIEVVLSDENPFDLLFKFDDDYMSRLGLEGYFALDIPQEDGVWVEKNTSKNGIYKIERTDLEEQTTLIIYGVYLYDDQNPAGNVDLGYSLYARDAVGNENTKTDTITVKNTQPSVELKFETIEENIRYIYIDKNNPKYNRDEPKKFNLHSMTADFNLPVKNVTPFQHHNATTGFAFKKPFLSIFKNGAYTVTYDDIFGNSYSEQKEVSDIVNNMDIILGGVDPNTGKYLFSIESKGLPFSVFADCYEGSFYHSGYLRLLNANKMNLTEFKKDENIIVLLMVELYSGWYIDTDAPVIVIDGNTRQAPKVTVHWYYHEFDSSTVPEGEEKTDNNVDVWITADSPITGINGKLTSHTFLYNEATSYVFEYQDGDGNVGVEQVDLPIQIIDKKEKEDNYENYIHDDSTGFNEEDLIMEDKTPPNFYIDVYGKIGNITQFIDIWEASSGAEIEGIVSGPTSWASGYIFKFNISDESKTKMVLLDGYNAATEGITYVDAVSQPIEGVISSGRNIGISNAAALTVVIIDEKNNFVTVSFPGDIWNKLDSIPPEIDIIKYEPLDFISVNTLFTLKDDKSSSEEITLISPVGLSKDLEGRYILTFNENKSVEITMRDLAGNIGTGTISVDSIDDKVPVATVAWWSQYLIDGDYYDITQPTVTKTDKTMTVKVVFSKTIKSAFVKVYHNSVLNAPLSEIGDHEITDEIEKYVTCSYDTDNTIINFLQNATVDLYFTSLNDAADYIRLTIDDIIDKEAPTFTMDITDNAIDTTATVIFKEFSEPVYVSGHDETGSKLYEKDAIITKTFTQQGTYTFRFTDKAGNITTKEIKITNIDEYPPLILLDLPPIGTYYKDTLTFKATMSEKGTLTYNGVIKNVEAPVDINGDGKFDNDECNWVEFEATQNGSYKIIATDIAGRKTTAFVTINCFDKTAPKITLTPVTLTVLNSTDYESFKRMLMEGVIVEDDITAENDINISCEYINSSQLEKAGLYSIVYTATDSVGNERKATRYVKVFSARDLNITVNDKRTEPNGVTLITGQKVDLSVYNLPLGEGEPYKVYLRKGRWTAGEMKSISKLDDLQNIILPNKDCYYTLYIVTQNRGTYLTYLYAQ